MPVTPYYRRRRRRWITMRLTIAAAAGGSSPPPPWSATDNFNRAGPSLGADWTDLNAGFTIVGNELSVTAAQRSSVWNDPPPSADYWVQGTLDGGAPASTIQGIALRIADAANMYAIHANVAADRLYLRRKLTTTWAVLRTYINTIWPRTVKLEVSGTTLKVTIGGTPQPDESDSNISAAGQAGVCTHSSGTTPGTIDDWSAGL